MMVDRLEDVLVEMGYDLDHVSIEVDGVYTYLTIVAPNHLKFEYELIGDVGDTRLEIVNALKTYVNFFDIDDYFERTYFGGPGMEAAEYYNELGFDLRYLNKGLLV